MFSLSLNAIVPMFAQKVSHRVHMSMSLYTPFHEANARVANSPSTIEKKSLSIFKFNHWSDMAGITSTRAAFFFSQRTTAPFEHHASSCFGSCRVDYTYRTRRPMEMQHVLVRILHTDHGLLFCIAWRKRPTLRTIVCTSSAGQPPFLFLPFSLVRRPNDVL